MIYAIIGIIVVVSLFLIFRDDHDHSYNKNEKDNRNAPPKAEMKAPGPSLKKQILGEIEAAISEVKKGWDTTSARLIAEIKVIIPCSREYVEAEIEDGCE